MRFLKPLASAALCAALVISSTAVFSAAAKKPTIKVANKASSIKVKWSKVKGAKKYSLLCKKGSGKFKKVYSGSKTSFSFKMPKAGKKYTFKVKAAGGKYSAAKSIIRLKTADVFYAEEDLDMKGIILKWTKVKGAKQYLLYRSVRSKDSFKKIAAVSSSVSSFHDKGLKSIESYKYYVVAVNGSSKSAKGAQAHEIYGCYNFKTNAPLTLTIKKGEKYTDIFEKLDRYFATGLVKWKSLNTKIVKVSSVGEFTGVKKGKATVLATVKKGAYKNNKEKTIKINVTVK